MTHQLLSDIINELIDVTQPLSAPLLKTKVLASRIQNAELLAWVNQELNGYWDDEEQVPDYRTINTYAIIN